MPVKSLVVGLVVAIAATEPQIETSDPLPDMELLEFLGEWETVSGKWIDPTALADDSEVLTKPQQEENHD